MGGKPLRDDEAPPGGARTRQSEDLKETEVKKEPPGVRQPD
ncbi:hypothetical protein [Bradyrhizobium sp. CCGE-LA001]|nr:hypothetical protein [Bradyrhizobium sp. CCGE-LA001]